MVMNRILQANFRLKAYHLSVDEYSSLGWINILELAQLIQTRGSHVNNLTQKCVWIL